MDQYRAMIFLLILYLVSTLLYFPLAFSQESVSTIVYDLSMYIVNTEQ